MSRTSYDAPLHDASPTSSPEICALMFSGGRDSTLAAVRLLRRHFELLLITVSSNHLVGIEQVRRRLAEFRQRPRMRATWMLVAQPPEFASAMPTEHQTCLPCHMAYAGIGLRMSLASAAKYLAFGYAGYQAHWLEQRPDAVHILRKQLHKSGVRLLLPVSDIASKRDAVRELRAEGLNDNALEQKCLLQQLNVPLRHDEASAEIDRWGRALAGAFCQARQTNFRILERVRL